MATTSAQSTTAQQTPAANSTEDTGPPVSNTALNGAADAPKELTLPSPPTNLTKEAQGGAKEQNDGGAEGSDDDDDESTPEQTESSATATNPVRGEEEEDVEALLKRATEKPCGVPAFPISSRGSQAASGGPLKASANSTAGVATTLASPFSLEDELQIKVITWNMEGTCGPDDISELLQPDTHHLYAIGTEECERSIAKSYVNSSKGKWEEKLVTALGTNYEVVASHTMMAIHLVVFARRDVVPFVSQIQSMEIATGLLNGKVGNKGGVCISMLVGSTSVLFINAHFAAHQTKVFERNNDFWRIVTSCNLRCSKTAAESSSDKKPEKDAGGTVEVLEGEDATDCFDVVFFSGDLNYRIDGERHMVDVLLKDDRFREVLLANDQLSKERKNGKVFKGFREGPLSFLPTYKYHKENGRATDSYDQSQKRRIPAWTDRILFKTKSLQTIKLFNYTALDCKSLRCSDHRPVIAEIGLTLEGSPLTTASGEKGQAKASPPTASAGDPQQKDSATEPSSPVSPSTANKLPANPVRPLSPAPAGMAGAPTSPLGGPTSRASSGVQTSKTCIIS